MPEPVEPLSAWAPPRSWSTERILPEGFRPMLASAATGPLDSPDYGYEVRWEGLRLLAGLEGTRPAFRTGAGQEPRFWFPELSKLRAAAEPDWILLDGELVVTEHGWPSALLLQRRLKAADAAAVERLAAEAPATFMVYDILRIGNSWLLDVVWEDRRDILGRAVSTTQWVRHSPALPEGRPALARARDLRLEAVVAKRLRGRYLPGERTRDWLDIKPLEMVEAVIGGWTEGRGARSGMIGTLVLGLYRERQLVWVGHTGAGMDAEILSTLWEELRRRAQQACPFSRVPAVNTAPHWVRPELVCRVHHHGWTEAGKLRLPAFVELARKRSPEDCRFPERLAPAGERL